MNCSRHRDALLAVSVLGHLLVSFFLTVSFDPFKLTSRHVFNLVDVSIYRSGFATPGVTVS